LFSAGVAQTGVKLTGHIADNSTPLDMVTVALYKLTDTTKAVQFTTTDSSGYFNISSLQPGQYLIKFSLVGYKTKTAQINIAPEVTTDLQLLSLIKDDNYLKTVTVTAQKKLIEKTPTGFIINAATHLTAISGTATDLLKNTPTVSVDADGGVTLRGKTPLVLINGRNSTLTNLDQIAASSIESIEIINNPSARYDANAESGIINIRLKKNKQNGTNGAIALGAGMGSRGRINSSVLLNHKTQKWNLGMGYDNRFAGRTRKITSTRTNFYLPDEYFLNQYRNDKRLDQLQNLKLNLDFSPNTLHSFSFEAIGNKEGQDNDENLFSTLYKSNNELNSNTNRHALELERSKVAEFALGYNRKFEDDRKTLAINLTSSLNKDRENTTITSHQLDKNNLFINDPSYQKTHNYENGNITTALLDYAVPVSKKGLIETGYKGIYRSIAADFLTADLINNVYVPNTAASNIFNFNEQVQALYFSFSSQWGVQTAKKWKYNLGIRGEQVTNNGHTQTNSTKFNNHYFKVFPTASLVFYKNPETYFKLSYGKRINRPGLGQLNPFTDITDSLNPHSGNPNLKPEIIHAIEVGYSKEGPSYSFSSNLFYRYALNTIRQFAQLQPNGASLTFPVNIGTAVTYGIENVFSAHPATFYDLNASISLFQQHLSGSIFSEDIVQNAFGWNAKLINNLVPWQGSKLQITGNYNSALATPQGKRIAQYFADIGFQQKLGKGNTRLGLIVSDVFNTFKSGFENNTSDFKSYRTGKADTRAFIITFAYTFKAAFKEKLLENQFSRDY
ncbi:MAG: hypothetical protein RLZZ316_3028, partial [Bacteroidota bacterium]